MEEINKNLRYLVMPDYVYSDSNLTDISRRVYCFIHTFKGNYFLFSNDHMAKMFNCTAQSISDSIQKLEELKYIKTEYQVKTGGGKTRLVIDLYSDYNSSYSRPQKIEPTTTTPVIDNDINGNNKMGENFLSPSLKELQEARKLRKARKQPFGYSRPSEAPKKEYPKARGRKVTYARDIV